MALAVGFPKASTACTVKLALTGLPASVPPMPVRMPLGVLSRMTWLAVNVAGLTFRSNVTLSCCVGPSRNRVSGAATGVRSIANGPLGAKTTAYGPAGEPFGMPRRYVVVAAAVGFPDPSTAVRVNGPLTATPLRPVTLTTSAAEIRDGSTGEANVTARVVGVNSVTLVVAGKTGTIVSRNVAVGPAVGLPAASTAVTAVIETTFPSGSVIVAAGLKLAGEIVAGSTFWSNVTSSAAALIAVTFMTCGACITYGPGMISGRLLLAYGRLNGTPLGEVGTANTSPVACACTASAFWSIRLPNVAFPAVPFAALPNEYVRLPGSDPPLPLNAIDHWSRAPLRRSRARRRRSLTILSVQFPADDSPFSEVRPFARFPENVSPSGLASPLYETFPVTGSVNGTRPVPFPAGGGGGPRGLGAESFNARVAYSVFAPPVPSNAPLNSRIWLPVGVTRYAVIPALSPSTKLRVTVVLEMVWPYGRDDTWTVEDSVARAWSGFGVSVAITAPVDEVIDRFGFGLRIRSWTYFPVTGSIGRIS